MTVHPELSTREEPQLMTTPTTPPPPSDEPLVTQLRALGVIYAGWARLHGEDLVLDAAVGLRPRADPLREAEVTQMVELVVQAVADGHAEPVAEPDEDGYRQLRLTEAGIAVLDQVVAEKQAAKQIGQGSP